MADDASTTALQIIQQVLDDGHTVADVAAVFDVSDTTIYHWRRTGKVPVRRLDAVRALPDTIAGNNPDGEPVDCRQADCTSDGGEDGWCLTHRGQLQQLTKTLHGRHGPAAAAKAAEVLEAGDPPAHLLRPRP